MSDPLRFVGRIGQSRGNYALISSYDAGTGEYIANRLPAQGVNALQFEPVRTTLTDYHFVPEKPFLVRFPSAKVEPASVLTESDIICGSVYDLSQPNTKIYVDSIAQPFRITTSCRIIGIKQNLSIDMR